MLLKGDFSTDIFLWIFEKNTYFVECLQRLLLPIAASAVENVLRFNIFTLAAFAKLPE